MGERQSPFSSAARSAFQALVPNGGVTPREENLIRIAWIGLILALWSAVKIPFLPQPVDIIGALPNLWMDQGLAVQAQRSFLLNLKALLWSTGISLLLCYLIPVGLVRPLASAVSKGRFLGLSGLFVFFALHIKSIDHIKLSMLVFGETVFFVTSMYDVVVSIPKEKFDHARTQGMGEWRVIYEVVVLGTVPQVFDIVRANAAIGWTLLTMVEGVSRSEGGLGGMILNGNKHFKLEELLAVQLTILVIGVMQDFLLQWSKKTICPYSVLKLERR